MWCVIFSYSSIFQISIFTKWGYALNYRVVVMVGPLIQCEILGGV